MNFSKYIVGATCSVLALASAASAGDKEEALIDRIVAAYGGDVILNAKALNIKDRYKILSIGQSAHPDQIDIAHNNISLIVDLKGKRKSVQSWNKGRGGVNLGQNIHDGKTGHNLDHIEKTHAENTNLSYDVLGGGLMRTSDIALVYVMLEGRDEAVHGGTSMYRGTMHEKLTFKMASSPDLTIFVDKNTGYISKMTRQNPQIGELSYVFNDYRKKEGFTYAHDMNFFIAGQPNIVSVARSVDINQDISAAFDVPESYKPLGKNIDTSKMVAKKLAEGVYYSGLNGGFSIFVDAGDHYIGAGGYTALPDRLKAVQELAGNEKPLGKQVVTHHHSDILAL